MQRTLAWRSLLPAAAALLLALSPAMAQSALEEQVERARELLGEQRYEQALGELDAVIDENDGYAPAHYLRGIALGSLGREREALDAFVRATELSPGWGEAHRLAALAALNTRDLPLAWDHAIKAHQAGADVSESINRLLALEKAPADLDAQLAAARVYVMPLNTEKLAAEQQNPWGVDVVGGGGGGIPDPFNVSGARATGQGNQKITQAQSSFYNLLQQMRRSLSNSRYFGVVQQPDMAQYLLVVEVDELDGGHLRGYIKMYDARSGEEAYRRLLELRNIDSLADLNADLERYVGYMQEWLLERAG
jgi:tetratricopeptide (TPR) repeat protein